MPLPVMSVRTTPASSTASFHAELAQRLGMVADGLSYKDIGDRTGTNFETARRYMRTGVVPARFVADFCTAFDVNPQWLLFGAGRMRAR